MNLARIKRRKSDRHNSSLMLLSQVSYLEDDDENVRLTDRILDDIEDSPNMVLEAEENVSK